MTWFSGSPFSCCCAILFSAMVVGYYMRGGNATGLAELVETALEKGDVGFSSDSLSLQSYPSKAVVGLANKVAGPDLELMILLTLGFGLTS